MRPYSSAVRGVCLNCMAGGQPLETMAFRCVDDVPSPNRPQPHRRPGAVPPWRGVLLPAPQPDLVTSDPISGGFFS